MALITCTKSLEVMRGAYGHFKVNLPIRYSGVEKDCTFNTVVSAYEDFPIPMYEDFNNFLDENGYIVENEHGIDVTPNIEDCIETFENGK